VDSLESTCSRDREKYEEEQRKCHRGAQSPNNSGLYEVDDDGTCTIKEVGSKSNPNQGECNNAELLRGTNLRGETCKDAAQAIKNVQAQQESVGAATTAAVQGYSSYQATMATGQQADAQMQQKKILQTLAVAKIATGALQMAGAAQLKSAAGKAEGSASGISSAHQGLRSHCDAAAKRENISDEQCFYKYAHEYEIIGDAKEYANFERLKSAQIQSQEQADRANAMAKSSMISGMADAFVGIQAMMMARQAQQNAAYMAPPPPPPIPGYNLGGASQGGLAGGGGATPGTNYTPTDFGGGGGDGATLGGMTGPIGNGIKGGKGFAATPGGKAAVSTVSTSGGGGGGGGGGGSGASRGGGGRRGGGPSNTASAEFNLAGGGGGFRGGSGPAEKNEGGNAFADALAKLFPQDPTGKPVVDAPRGLASEGVDMMEGAYVGSEVEAVDVSLFEQITAKYRQLAGAGNI
jgi:hypothetical protein